MHGIIVLVYILGYYTVYTEVALVVSHQVFTRASMHQSVEQDRLMRSGTFLLSFWGWRSFYSARRHDLHAYNSQMHEQIRDSVGYSTHAQTAHCCFSPASRDDIRTFDK